MLISIISLFNDKLIVICYSCMRKLVRKSYTPVVPIANTCSIGYPHDGRANNAAYRHDRRADSLSHYTSIEVCNRDFPTFSKQGPGTNNFGKNNISVKLGKWIQNRTGDNMHIWC